MNWTTYKRHQAYRAIEDNPQYQIRFITEYHKQLHDQLSAMRELGLSGKPAYQQLYNLTKDTMFIKWFLSDRSQG